MNSMYTGTITQEGKLKPCFVVIAIPFLQNFFEKYMPFFQKNLQKRTRTTNKARLQFPSPELSFEEKFVFEQKFARKRPFNGKNFTDLDFNLIF